ncbi:MAG: Malonyl CoA-acyl carrier protein transacylase [Chroococcopsis gigantea SAG 12.99]|jgi:[acyl-carrier-protein] S-malonyltransferase|nr:ACP S-malonyltransferase [Chlorogloea purpurea SAG 13.99]MDV3002312.1 Malonyl CoA-acyl carrier protein transacylase [Chroococcopsis gigantea SAG 12.99]
MTKIWVFPGQGSQTPGMEADLAQTDIGKNRFAEASALLGWSVLEKCQGDEETLSRTVYTQPCLFVVESILTDLLKDKGYSPDQVAGHSLGEYSALYAAGVFDFATGLNLVRHRSQLMDKAAGGKMAAIMKFDRTALENLMATTADVVIANDNSPEQVVISGTPSAVDKILSEVKAKRAVPLKVSGAFHSPLMAIPAEEFQRLLNSTSFHDATVPVLSNVDPRPCTGAETLKHRLVAQMTGSVRWRETMLEMSKIGVTEAIEVGPGKVLTGLIKRTCEGLTLTNVSNLSEIALLNGT